MFSMHINYLTYTQKEMFQMFEETMDHFNFTAYIAVEEVGTKNKLKHLQVVCWHSDQNINKKACSIKSYKFNKQRLHKKSNKDVTQISFAIAKGQSLVSYASKEIHNSPHITNLTEEELALIPKWETQDDKKKADRQFNKKITDFAKARSKTHPQKFRNLIILEYKKHDRIPSIHTLRKLTLFHNHFYTPQDYQDEVGSLRNTRFEIHWKEEEIQNLKYANKIDVLNEQKYKSSLFH